MPLAAPPCATTIPTELTEPCTRCGGTGRHGYCRAAGDRCFKCGGTGRQLTRAARKAHAAAQHSGYAR